MRQNLNCKLIAITQEFLRLHTDTDTGWCTSQDNSTCRQRSALRTETDEFRNLEDQITEIIKSAHEQSLSETRETRTSQKARNRKPKTRRRTPPSGKKERNTYSVPQSCKTRPFFNPLTHNLVGSDTKLGETRTGPIGHAPSKPLL